MTKITAGNFGKMRIHRIGKKFLGGTFKKAKKAKNKIKKGFSWESLGIRGI